MGVVGTVGGCAVRETSSVRLTASNQRHSEARESPPLLAIGPFYHGENETLERGRDLPKVIVLAGFISTTFHYHFHPIPAETSDMI